MEVRLIGSPLARRGSGSAGHWVLAGALLVGVGGIPSAGAQPRGRIVVALPGADAIPSGTVPVFTMTSPTGAVTRIDLHDDGVIPDSAAGDGMYAGGNWFDREVTSGVLQVGDRVYPPVALSFGMEENPWILLEIVGGVVRIPGDSAGGGEVGQGGRGTPSGTGSPMVDPPSNPLIAKGGPVVTPTEGGSRGYAGTQTGASGPAFVAFGVGTILAIVGGLLWWTRQRGSVAPAPMSRLQPRPDAGLVGPGTPSLSDGLALWVAPPDDLEALIAPLLRTLARDRPVLVVAAKERVLPRVHGAAVYRCPGLTPADVRGSLDQLDGEEAMAVLVLDVPPGGLVPLADALPASCGGVALCAVTAELPPLPLVDCRREGQGWVVRSGRRGGRLVEGPMGLVPVESAPVGPRTSFA